MFLDEAKIWMEIGDSTVSGEFENIKTLEDLEKIDRYLGRKNGDVKAASLVNSQVVRDVDKIISYYIPYDFEWGDRTEFKDILGIRDLYNSCKTSFMNGLKNGRTMSDADFDEFYDDLAHTVGRQVGNAECLFPIFFKNVTAQTTEGNGDLVCKDKTLVDVKGFGSTSYGLKHKGDRHLSSYRDTWRKDLNLSATASNFDIALAQILSLKSRFAIFMSEDLRMAKTIDVQSLRNYAPHITDANVFMASNGFRYKNKGGNSEGLAINYVPRFDKNGDGIVPHS